MTPLKALAALEPLTPERARRQLAAAKGSLTRARRKLEETPSGYSIYNDVPGTSDEWNAANYAVERAERRLEAARARLDAVESQVPHRYVGGER